MIDVVRIDAVGFREGGAWVVHGVNFDIVAQTAADSPVEAFKAFLHAVMERIAIARHLGTDPFKNLGPAPEHIRAKFERADTLTIHRPVEDDPAPTNAEVSMRLAEAA